MTARVKLVMTFGIWNIVILGVSVSVYWEENLCVRPHVPTNTHLIIELSILLIFSDTCNIFNDLLPHFMI